MCRSSFVYTLNIGKTTVNNTMKKKDMEFFVAQDERGIILLSNKTLPGQLEEVRRHIESFPRIESHMRKTNHKGSICHPISQLEECARTTIESMKPCEEKNIQNITYHFIADERSVFTLRLCNINEMKEKRGAMDENSRQQYADHHDRTQKPKGEKDKEKGERSTNTTQILCCII